MIGLAKTMQDEVKEWNVTRNKEIERYKREIEDKSIVTGLSEKFDMLLDEVEKVWEHIQSYTDISADDFINDINNKNKDLQTKMDRMGWLARNSEYLSPENITRCLTAFKS